MNWFDLIIIIILLAHLIPGYQQGLIVQLAGLIGIGLGIYCAYLYSPILGFEILKRWDFNPVVIRALSFIAIMLFTSQLIVLIALGINKLFSLPVIGLFNRLAGAILGLIKGGVLVLIGITILQTIPLGLFSQIVKQSELAGLLIRLSPCFYQKIKEVVGIALEQYKNSNLFI